MTLKEIGLLVLTHTLLLLAGIMIFVSLFHTNLFSNMYVFFYRGILLLFISCVLFAVTQVGIKRIKAITYFTYRDIVLSVTLLFSICIVLFTHLPVTAERSVSVFMLGYMNQNSNQVFTQKDLKKIFNDVYINDHTAIDKRLEEQIISGNISQNGDTYQITNQGKHLMDLYIKIADLFKIDKKNLST